MMRFPLRLAIVMAAPRSGVSEALDAFASNLVVNEDDTGIVAYLYGQYGTEPYTFAIVSDPSSVFTIANGNELTKTGTFPDTNDYSLTIRITDDNGDTVDEVFIIDVVASGTAPTDPQVQPDDLTVQAPTASENDDGFTETPVAASTQDGIKLSGKNGGATAFVYDMGVPNAGSIHTVEVQADFSSLSKDGRKAAVGFGFRDADDNFHIVGLRGDGNVNTSMLVSRITGSFGSAKNFSLSNDGAATNGTRDGANWHRVTIDSDGLNYTYSTSADGNTWDAELTDYLPSPLSYADDAVQFGLAVYFAADDKGPFSLNITYIMSQETLDPYFNLVGIKYDFQGTDGASPNTTNEGFPTGSPNNTITASGSAQLDTDIKKVGVSSLLMSADADYVTVNNTANSWLRLDTVASPSYTNTQAWTIEFWVYQIEASLSVPRYCLSKQGGSHPSEWYIRINTNQSITMYGRNTGGQTLALTTSANALTPQTWTHLAFQRIRGTWYLFINGRLDTTQAQTGSITQNSSQNLLIGRNNYAGNEYGHIQMAGLRITRRERYDITANFIPPRTVHPTTQMVAPEIGRIKDLVCWLTPDSCYTDAGKTTLCASTDDLCYTWADISGNGNDWVQTTSGSRPLYKTSVVNGENSLFGDTTWRGLAGTYAYWSLIQAADIFMVVKSNSSSTGGPIDFGLNGSSNHYPYSDTKVYTDFMSQTGRASFTPTQAVSNWNVLSFRGGGNGALYTYLNGVQENAISVSDWGWRNPPQIFAGMHGWIAEVIIVARWVSADERAFIDGYLGTKYGITIP